MQLSESILNQNPTFSEVVHMEAPGFSFSIKGSVLEWTDLSGNGSLWRDQSGTFELTRELDSTPTGIRIHTSIRNVTSDVAPLLMALEVLNLPLVVRPEDWVSYSCKGGVTDWWVPPEAYRTQRVFGLEQALYLQSHGAGRSTNDELPLLICIAEPLAAGFFFGMEWSGEWVMKLARGPEGGVTAAAFLKSSLMLRAGESRTLPIVHLGFFGGGFAEGSNALRRHIYEQVCPPLPG